MRRLQRAFTLIELLVVLAIIGLLVSLIGPQLAASRKAAQQAVCLSNNRQIGIGLANYYAAYKDWLPGMTTSGLEIMKTDLLSSSTLQDVEDAAAGPDKPVSYSDWISPTMGNELAMPANPYERLIDIANGKLRCPSNSMRCREIVSGAGQHQFRIDLPPYNKQPQDMFMMSYAANINFQMGNDVVALDEAYAEVTAAGAQANAARMLQAYDQWPLYRTQMPPGYNPRSMHIKNPSRKAWVAEGVRYWSGGQANSVDYPSMSTFVTESYAFGGNFMQQFGVQQKNNGGHPWKWGTLFNFSGSLISQSTTGWSKAKLDNIAARTDSGPFGSSGMSPMTQVNGFRHLNNTNAVTFFDGHAELMKGSDLADNSVVLPTGYRLDGGSTGFWDEDKSADPNDALGDVVD